jgi:hypothetical protein
MTIALKRVAMALAVSAAACGRSDVASEVPRPATASSTWQLGDCSQICESERESLVRDFEMRPNDVDFYCSRSELRNAASSEACRCAFVNVIGVDFPNDNIVPNAYLAPAANPSHCEH